MVQTLQKAHNVPSRMVFIKSYLQWNISTKCNQRGSRATRLDRVGGGEWPLVVHVAICLVNHYNDDLAHFRLKSKSSVVHATVVTLTRQLVQEQLVADAALGNQILGAICGT